MTEANQEKSTIPNSEKYAMVAAEFDYIAQTAFQANEDRARVFQFFFVTFATFVAALLSSQFDSVDATQLYTAYAILLFINSILGAFTNFQLARLRLAWIESARAMNQIKEHMIAHDDELGEFFRWRMNTIPRAIKPSSISFILAIMVGIVGGLAAGGGVGFLSLASGNNSLAWMPATSVGFMVSLLTIGVPYIVPLALGD